LQLTLKNKGGICLLAVDTIDSNIHCYCDAPNVGDW